MKIHGKNRGISPERSEMIPYQYANPKITTAPWWKILLAKLFGRFFAYFDNGFGVKGYCYRGVYYITELIEPQPKAKTPDAP